MPTFLVTYSPNFAPFNQGVPKTEVVTATQVITDSVGNLIFENAPSYNTVRAISNSSWSECVQILP